jgi:hypothetical protein
MASLTPSSYNKAAPYGNFGKMTLGSPITSSFAESISTPNWAKRYLEVPSSFLDSPKNENENRVSSLLRSMAKCDLKTLLAYAAIGTAAQPMIGDPRVLVPINLSPAEVDALAQLAVTSRWGFNVFAYWRPKDADLIAYIKTMTGVVGAIGRNLSQPVLLANVQNVLRMAYITANLLRAKDPLTYAQFVFSPWMAVSGEDNHPHRPVNVPSAPFPQYDLALKVDAYPVVIRYAIASTSNRIDTKINNIMHPVLPVGYDFGYNLPDETPSIPASDKIIIYIHGDGSRLEEAMDLVPQLHAQAQAAGMGLFAAEGDIARRFFGRFGGSGFVPAIGCKRVSHNFALS